MTLTELHERITHAVEALTDIETDHLDRDERDEAHDLRVVIDQLTDTLEEWTGS